MLRFHWNLFFVTVCRNSSELAAKILHFFEQLTKLVRYQEQSLRPHTGHRILLYFLKFPKVCKCKSLNDLSLLLPIYSMPKIVINLHQMKFLTPPLLSTTHGLQRKQVFAVLSRSCKTTKQLTTAPGGQVVKKVITFILCSCFAGRHLQSDTFWFITRKSTNVQAWPF